MFQTNHVGSTTQSEADVATADWLLLEFRLIVITKGVSATPDRHYLSQRWGAYQINLSGENQLARSKGWCIDTTVTTTNNRKSNDGSSGWDVWDIYTIRNEAQHHVELEHAANNDHKLNALPELQLSALPASDAFEQQIMLISRVSR